jgi:ribosomal-protein-serine acetyltransferase
MKRFLGKRGGAKNRAACALAVDTRTMLVPIGRADAPAVFRLVDRNRSGLVPWMPWARDATAVTTEAFVAEAVAAAQSGSGFHFTLWCANEPVGAIGLHQIDPRYRCAQMGYWLDAGAAGRGLATGASRRLLTWAFDDLGLERVELRVHPRNARSRAVAERLGCLYEGRLCEESMPEDLRDLDVFVMTARRWDVS